MMKNPKIQFNEYSRKSPYSILLLLFFSVFILSIIIWKSIMKDCSQDLCGNTQMLLEYDYNFYKGRDVEGGDLMHVQASDISAVKKVCDLFHECVGFNSNGWLKTSSSSSSSSQSDLYIKYKITNKELDQVSKAIPSALSSNDFNTMSSNLKVYMYETTVGSQYRPHRYGGYMVERTFVDYLRSSKYITHNPTEATFFFIPLRCSSYIFANEGIEQDSIAEAKKITAKMIQDIQTNYPYWNWSSGSDHFYICAHDIGAEIGENLLKNAIALVNTADYDDHYFIPHKDISIPPTLSPGLNSMLQIGKGGANVPPSARKILAFFAGDVTVGRIRPTAWRLWSSDPDIKMMDHQVTPKSYIDYMKKSKYCLILRGVKSWSPRLIEAVIMGCVPVILSDHFHLPFQGIVGWETFSVIIPEKQIADLKKILLSIDSQRLIEMQIQLHKVHQYFSWSQPNDPQGAFQTTLLLLWHRRNIVKYKNYPVIS